MGSTKFEVIRRNNKRLKQERNIVTCANLSPIPEDYNLHSITLYVILFVPHILVSSNGYDYGINSAYTVNWEDTVYSPIYLANQMNIGMFIYLYIISAVMLISFFCIITSLVLNKINLCQKLIFYQSIIVLILVGIFIPIQFAVNSPSVYDFNMFSFGVCYIGTCADYFIITSKPKLSPLPR